jgi:hypothetical protein
MSFTPPQTPDPRSAPTAEVILTPCTVGGLRMADVGRLAQLVRAHRSHPAAPTHRSPLRGHEHRRDRGRRRSGAAVSPGAPVVSTGTSGAGRPPPLPTGSPRSASWCGCCRNDDQLRAVLGRCKYLGHGPYCRPLLLIGRYRAGGLRCPFLDHTAPWPAFPERPATSSNLRLALPVALAAVRFTVSVVPTGILGRHGVPSAAVLHSIPSSWRFLC